ncbi:MAG: patatin-like phospholipase family protein [Candidatus Gastranaerophilales bacterium]|nr:patatin-like phospholipase family protein [Candidatus Gastranaerophilales bacterium]
MENYSKYLCIFGGGAVRGYAYLGVLKAFEEIGFIPQKLAGSSVGSVFAAFYALGVPLNEMSELFFNVNFEIFRDINFKILPSFSISKGGVFLDWIREVIEKYYYKEDYVKGKNPPVCFKDIERDLYFIATNLTDETPFIFSKETTPDYEVAMAIRASVSLPGLLTPIQYKDKYLADGDLMKSNPIWRLNKILCPEDLRILEIRLEGTYKNSDVKNALDYFSKVYNCIVSYSTNFIIDVYGKKDKFDYIKVDTKDLALVNFNISKEDKLKLVDIGYQTTMKFFKEDLPLKRKCVLYDYKLLQSKLEELEYNIIKSDIKQSKKLLGDTFEILSDIKKIIDRTIYHRIKFFGNLFNENLTCGFFGIEKLKDKKLILKELNNLLTDLTKKCEELSQIKL